MPDLEALQDLARQMAWLRSERRYGEAIAAAARLCEMAREAFGANHPDYAECLSKLADLHRETGDVATAIPLYESVLRIRIGAFGEEHPQVAGSMHGLGVLLGMTGDYERAEPLLLKAAEIAEHVRGRKHPEFAMAQASLGMLYKSTGRFAEAEARYQEALAIRKELYGDRHPAVASVLNNLAMLYSDTGRREEAEPLLEQCAAIYGEDNPEFARALNNLGGLRYEMGKLPGAETALEQAVAAARRLLGPRHPETLQYQVNLGEVLTAQRHFESAARLLEETLAAQPQADHPLRAQTLNNLGGAYEHLDRIEEAERLYRMALELRRRVLRPDDPVVAATAGNLVRLYKKQQRYAEAEPLVRESLQILARRPGGDDLRLARELEEAASLYLSMRNLRQAEPLLERALAIRREKLGGRHPEVALTLLQLAGLYDSLGKPQASSEALRQAQAAGGVPGLWAHQAGGSGPEQEQALRSLAAASEQQFGKEHPRTQTIQIALANWLAKTGRLSAAESLLTELPQTAPALHALASVSRAQGRLDEAERLYRQLPADDLEAVAGLALVLHERGEYATAEVLYEQAAGLARRAYGDDHPDLAQIRNNEAALMLATGKRERAFELLQEALEIKRRCYGDTHPEVALTLNNLAEWYSAAGLYPQAERSHRQALAIVEKALGAEHPETAAALNNLAGALEAQGSYAEAEQLYEAGLAIRRKAFGNLHRDVANSLNNLGSARMNSGRYAEAGQLLMEALEISRRVLGDAHPQVSGHLNNLAQLAVRTGRLDEALERMKEAAAIDDRLTGQVFSTGSEQRRMEFLGLMHSRLSGFLSLLRLSGNSAEYARAALDLVLRRKALAGEAALAQRQAIFSERYPELRGTLEALTALRAQIAEATLNGPGSLDPAAHRERLEQWERQREALETELARSIPEMRLEAHFTSASRERVARAMPPGSVLIEIARHGVLDFDAPWARPDLSWRGERYVAFVLPAGKPDAVEVIELGEADRIDAGVIAMQAAASGGSRNLGPAPDTAPRTAAPHPVAVELVRKLLPALQGRLQVIIAPDGDLSRLPFEILPLDDSRRMIDEYRISYAGCGRDLLRARATAAGASPPLVVADPDFDLSEGEAGAAAGASPGRRSRGLERGGMRFERLPGTRAEGEAIAALLGVQPLFGRDALEARLKEARSPRILHIASHGFFLENQQSEATAGDRLARLSGLENPLLRSGLALAGVNAWAAERPLPAGAEDGMLTAEDVTALDLLATDLVVLSACDTGLGDVRVGEGVLGLRRAFALAGARMLILSLWKVPDWQTKELMIDFYTRLGKGSEPADALRDAQLALKARSPDPRSWGAFICQGGVSTANSGS